MALLPEIVLDNSHRRGIADRTSAGPLNRHRGTISNSWYRYICIRPPCVINDLGDTDTIEEFDVRFEAFEGTRRGLQDEVNAPPSAVLDGCALQDSTLLRVPKHCRFLSQCRSGRCRAPTTTTTQRERGKGGDLLKFPAGHLSHTQPSHQNFMQSQRPLGCLTNEAGGEGSVCSVYYGHSIVLCYHHCKCKTKRKINISIDKKKLV